MNELTIDNDLLILNLDPELQGHEQLIAILRNNFWNVNADGRYINTVVDYSTIRRVKDIFAQLNWTLNLDAVTHIIEDFERERDEFDAKLARAATIKEDIDDARHWWLEIPRFQANDVADTALLPHQIMPICHAHALGNSANFSVPGGGKTWMAYALYFLLQNDPEPENVERLLVICPLSAFMAWEREYTRITGDAQRDNIVRVAGDEAQRQRIYGENREIFLINYEKTRNPDDRTAIINLLRNNKFLVILDESHKIKNFDSQQSQGVRELATHAHKRLILTGTPMPTRWADLWNQFNFLFPHEITRRDMLGGYEHYLTRVDDDADLAEIRDSLRPTWTRITKQQLGLQNIRPLPIIVPMSPRQTVIYDIIETQVLHDAEHGNWINALQNFAGFTWLIEVATDPALLRKRNSYSQQLVDIDGVDVEEIINQYSDYEEPGKLSAIKDLLQQDWFAQDREKVIIWCNYVSTMDKIANMIDTEDIDSQTRLIYGATRDQREEYLDDFMENNDCNILIANPASLSESVSLHMQCHRAIYVDRTYNAAHWMQSKERIYRIGSDMAFPGPDGLPKYYVLKSEYPDGTETIDELIHQRMERNEINQNQFLDSDDIDVHSLDIRYDEEQQDMGANMEDLRNLMESIRRRQRRRELGQNN